MSTTTLSDSLNANKETKMNDLATTDVRDLVTFDGGLQAGVVILADVSISMKGPRIRKLREELAGLWKEIGGSAKLLAFNGEVIPVAKPSQIPSPSGST